MHAGVEVCEQFAVGVLGQNVNGFLDIRSGFWCHCFKNLEPQKYKKNGEAVVASPLDGDPGGIQTHDFQNRNLTFYSAELRGRFEAAKVQKFHLEHYADWAFLLFHEFDSIRQLEKVVVGPDVKDVRICNKILHIRFHQINICGSQFVA